MINRKDLKISVSRVLLLVLVTLGISSLAAFAQSGGVKGKVHTASGKGISGATVTARKDGVDIASAKSDEKGNFVLNGLESGRYNIVFEAGGYSSGVLYNVEVKKREVSDLGDRLILSTDQGTLVLITGSIFFKEGTSITGAKVQLERINADGSVRKLGSAYTNMSGEFAFRQPEGAAKLRVRATYKGAEGEKDIEVDQAAVYRTAITLDISQKDK
jgi:hypothetical protein